MTELDKKKFCPVAFRVILIKNFHRQRVIALHLQVRGINYFVKICRLCIHVCTCEHRLVFSITLSIVCIVYISLWLINTKDHLDVSAFWEWTKCTFTTSMVYSRMFCLLSLISHDSRLSPLKQLQKTNL